MEVIRFGEPSMRAPLLFVHGSYCGAWIWERHFLPFFEKAGFYGAAISLRGHGKSPDASNIDQYGVASFLEDIAAGVALFDRPPVLLGHSLGGYLIQRYAMHNEVSGLVMMASPSLTGIGPSSQHILINHPLLAIQLGLLMAFGPSFTDHETVAGALFLNGIPPHEKEHMAALLQRESKLVTSEAFLPCWEAPSYYPPSFVIGGDVDVFVPVSDLRLSAEMWKADIEILPNVPHGLMLDPCWQKPAEKIRQWLLR